jgi:hypothetical protein
VIERIASARADELTTRSGGIFRILPSRNDRDITLGVSPDLATCALCLTEVHDPTDRRFAYAFANCTDCGPRLSILEGVPYDRPETTMAAFAMCDACRREYDDPHDRRFHAQPNACPACGPALRFERCADHAVVTAWPAISSAFWELIARGGSIAIKGIGGYHLACLATDESAVARLRARKLRPDKPLAVMARSLDALRRHCVVSPAEATALCALSFVLGFSFGRTAPPLCKMGVRQDIWSRRPSGVRCGHFSGGLDGGWSHGARQRAAIHGTLEVALAVDAPVTSAIRPSPSSDRVGTRGCPNSTVAIKHDG